MKKRAFQDFDFSKIKKKKKTNRSMKNVFNQTTKIILDTVQRMYPHLSQNTKLSLDIKTFWKYLLQDSQKMEDLTANINFMPFSKTLVAE